MTDLYDRERGYENQYAHKEKVSFEEEAKTCKAFGLWAAEQLKLSGSDVEAYAISVVEANLEEPGFDDVLRKVRADFDEKHVSISDEDMKAALDRIFKDVRCQLNHDLCDN